MPILDDDRGADLGTHERSVLEDLRESYAASNARLAELTGTPDWWSDRVDGRQDEPNSVLRGVVHVRGAELRNVRSGQAT